MIARENNENLDDEIIGVDENLDNDDFPFDQELQNEDETELNIQQDGINMENTRSKNRVNLDLILDVPVELEIELGRKRVPLEEVLELEAGSILPLDKTADEPVNLYVNGTLIATGILITVDEQETLGFQVTNIVNRTKRIISLK